MNIVIHQEVILDMHNYFHAWTDGSDCKLLFKMIPYRVLLLYAKKILWNTINEKSRKVQIGFSAITIRRQKVLIIFGQYLKEKVTVSLQRQWSKLTLTFLSLLPSSCRTVAGFQVFCPQIIRHVWLLNQWKSDFKRITFLSNFQQQITFIGTHI